LIQKPACDTTELNNGVEPPNPSASIAARAFGSAPYSLQAAGESQESLKQ
jgi:hypothetical protein